MRRPPPVPAQQVPPTGMRQLSTRGRLCPGQCPPRQRHSWHQGSGSHVSGLSRPLPGSPEGQVTCAHVQDPGWTLCLFCGTSWTLARLSLSPLLSWVCGSMPSAHSAELSLQALKSPAHPSLQRGDAERASDGRASNCKKNPCFAFRISRGEQGLVASWQLAAVGFWPPAHRDARTGCGAAHRPSMPGKGPGPARCLLHCGHRPPPPSGYSICCRRLTGHGMCHPHPHPVCDHVWGTVGAHALWQTCSGSLHHRLASSTMGGPCFPSAAPPFNPPLPPLADPRPLSGWSHLVSSLCPPHPGPLSPRHRGPGPGGCPSRSLRVKSLSSSVPWRHPTVHPAKAMLCDEAFCTPTTLPAHCPNVH